MSANPQNFEENYRWINELSCLVESIVPHQADEQKKDFHKRNSKNVSKILAGTFSALMEDKIKSGEGKRSSVFSPNDLGLSSSSFYKKSLTQNVPIFGESGLEKNLFHIQMAEKQILNAKYPSMREYRELKERCC